MARWLVPERGPADGGQHLRADDLVELTRAPSRFGADVFAAHLRSEGIRCVVFYEDAGGSRPELGFVYGHRVMVRAGDAAQAREIIGEP